MKFFSKTASSGLTNVRRFLALHVSRLARFALMKLGRQATSFPGKIALKLDPHFLTEVVANRPVVLVCGTNGKTTTTLALHALLKEAGQMPVTNLSGANMEDGIVATLVENYPLIRQSNQSPTFVFEVDEGWFPLLCQKTQPILVLNTNFFRDQLDRYGELEHTRSLIAKGISCCPESSQVVLCADDPLSYALSQNQKRPVYTFGLSKQAMPASRDDRLIESNHCPICHASLDYPTVFFSHYGCYSCHQCGYTRPNPDLTFCPADMESHSQQIKLRYRDQKDIDFVPGIQGKHNWYNFAGAALGAHLLGVDLNQAIPALENLSPPSGRMEEITLTADRSLLIILTKNPVSIEQALDHLHQIDQPMRLLLVLNDFENDGRDVSWIWDVDFEEKLIPYLQRIPEIFVSGTRGADMALRLYYAGVPKEKTLLTDSPQESIDKLLSSLLPGEKGVVLPNYTGLLAVESAVKSVLCKKNRGTESDGVQKGNHSL